MADGVNERKNRSDENPAVIGPAVVNPDHKSAHLEDTLSFFLPTKDTKASADESVQKEQTLHIPPAVLPNGEKVSSSKPTGSLKIPPAVPAGDSTLSGTEEFKVPSSRRKTSSYQPGTIFTSPFGPTGLEGSRSLRAGSTSRKPSEPVLNIPEVNIDHTSVFRAYGHEADEVAENAGILENAHDAPVSRKESARLHKELKEQNRSGNASSLPGAVVMPELFNTSEPGPQAKQAPAAKPAASRPQPEDDVKPYVPRRAAVKKEPPAEEDPGETRMLPKVDETISETNSEPAGTAPAKAAASARSTTPGRTAAATGTSSSRTTDYPDAAAVNGTYRKTRPSAPSG